MGSDIYAWDVYPKQEKTVLTAESALINGGATNRWIVVPEDFHRLIKASLIARSGGTIYSSAHEMEVYVGRVGEAYNTYDSGLYNPPNWLYPAGEYGEIDFTDKLPTLKPGDIIRVYYKNKNSTIYIYILGIRLIYK